MCLGWGDYTRGGHIYEKVNIVLKAVSIAKLDKFTNAQQNTETLSPLFPCFFYRYFFFWKGWTPPPFLVKIPVSAPAIRRFSRGFVIGEASGDDHDCPMIDRHSTF